MFSIRVTAPDGSTRTYPLGGTQCSIGRSADNDIVLEGTAVSSRHCMIEVSPSGVVLKDRGSSNGTWMNSRKLDEPSKIGEGDRIYVGNNLIELTRMAPPADRAAVVDRPPTLEGPLLRDLGPVGRWREQHERLRRFAQDWDRAGRPARLGLRPRELESYRAWMRAVPPGCEREITSLQREFLQASTKAIGRSKLVGLLAALGGVVVLTGLVLVGIVVFRATSSDDDDESPDATAATEGNDATDEADAFGFAEDDLGDPTSADADPDAVAANVAGAIEHVVIPKETVADIAERYGVSTSDLVDWNLINPDEPLAEGRILKLERPRRRPLPQQKVTYEVEPGETWTAVADRFGVAVTDLRGYNEGVEKIAAGTTLTVWIDPKPYAPRDPPLPIPDFHIDQRAVSIGAPNAGSLVNGIQLPESELYTRRYPNIMWGSSQTIANLQKAIAMFRRDVDYDAEVIVADISKQKGGHFTPHKSHQAGRDVDIWLPTLKGVYKRKYLEEDRKGRPYRPSFSEIDWYATWGLARALIQTGAVEEIFLDWDRQKYVYDAAVNMGATPEQLDEWIQYPRKATSSRGIFRHSANHFTHMHVRFKCAKWESDCRTRAVRP
jgi:pSer/pThr/pTyr-binding forkhead associated (FHA) protein/LysM repeat protein